MALKHTWPLYYLNPPMEDWGEAPVFVSGNLENAADDAVNDTAHYEGLMTTSAYKQKKASVIHGSLDPKERAELAAKADEYARSKADDERKRRDEIRRQRLQVRCRDALRLGAVA